MKTKELIELLKKADPTGEHDVTVGNCPILFVQQLPAYYDGKLQRLITSDGTGDPRIIGGQFVSQGTKVSIFYNSLKDLIMSTRWMGGSFP